MKEPHIVYAIAHHCESVESDVNVETLPLHRIDARSPQDLWMRRTPRHHLHPANALAHRATHALADEALHVDLESRLHEREVACSHPHRDLASEYRAQDGIHQEMPGGERHASIDHEGFVLEEGALVTCIGSLVSIHPARVDESEGRFALLHVAHTSSGQVRA